MPGLSREDRKARRAAHAITTVIRFPQWMDEGVCRDYRDLWDEFDEQAQKTICRGCPVAAACLDFALATRTDYEVYGGLTPKERWKITREMAS